MRRLGLTKVEMLGLITKTDMLGLGNIEMLVVLWALRRLVLCTWSYLVLRGVETFGLVNIEMFRLTNFGMFGHIRPTLSSC